MKKKLLFARIHYTGLFSNFKNNIYKDLDKINNHKGFTLSDSYNWYISNIKSETIKGIEIISGKLIKTKITEEVTLINKNTKEESIGINEDVKDNESYFIIYPNKNLISFETSKTLTKNQFTKVFITFYNNLDIYTNPEFDFIFDEGFLFEMLNNLKKINFARFDLKTTNPDSREDFKIIDDLFQKTNSETNHLKLVPKKGESLDFESKESLVRQGLSMSSQGFGKGDINGEDKSGKTINIKTGNNNLKEVNIDETKSTEDIKIIIIDNFISLQKPYVE